MSPPSKKIHIPPHNGPEQESLIAPAIALLHAKRTAEAEHYLRNLIADNEQDPEAWFWLGMAVKNKEDRLTAWHNALYLNPHHPRARRKLSQLYMQLAQQEPVATAAEAHLRQAVTLDETNQQAWLALADTAHLIEDRLIALENLRTLHPTNAITAAKLARLGRIAANPFHTAAYYIQRGDVRRAEEIYGQLMATAPKATTRNQAQLARNALRQRAQGQEQIPVPPPHRSAARFSFGPLLFYVLLVVFHIGLDLWQFMPVHLLGGLLVWGGTWFMLAVRHLPEHHWWTMVLGAYGLYRSVQAGIWALGLLTTAVPYLWLAWETWGRYQLFNPYLFIQGG